MSCNSNFSCRETYSSYGSYLRSRGYDKEICNLVFGIETGKIPIGPIIPGNCGNPYAPTTINNSVNINPCPTQPLTGILTVNGGTLGSLPDSNTDPASHFLSTSEKYGIQSTHGIRSLGPIVQIADCKHSNYFAAKSHIFDGGGDCSTNVIIRGDLQVDGSTVLLTNEIAETLTLVTQPLNQELGSLNIFRSPLALGNTMVVYNDTSNVVQNSPWEQTLHYAIDGNGGGGSVSDISRNVGLTNQPGHVRSLRGTTVMNPPLPGVSIIPYNTDISGSSIALDVYGDIIVNPGNNDASGNIDLSGGSINFYNNNTKNVFISSTGDASFNGHVTVNDLSVVNMATIGLNTTIIDTLSVETEFIKSKTLTDLRIRAGPLGERDVKFLQTGNSKVVMTDLSVNRISVNDLSVNNIDIVGTLVINDLSVNQHASIYDLSVSDLIQVGSDSINKTIIGQGLTQTVLSDCSFLWCAISGKFFGDCSVNDQLEVGQLIKTPIIESGLGTPLTIKGGTTGAQDVIFNQIGNSKVVMNDLSVNTYASIYDLSVTNFMTIGTSTTTIDTNSINATSGYFNDISVNDLSVNTLQVESLEIANQLVLQDLSVNNHTSINDLSVNGFSEFTGNFLINNIAQPLLPEAIKIQTNNGTADKILISNLQGDADDSILIKSTAGGVDINSDLASKFTTSNGKLTLQSGNNLELFAMGGNNVDISGAKIEVTGDLIVDGDISANGAISGFSFITPIIESGLGTPLIIQGGNGGQNVIFNQIGNSTVVMNDLSVNTYASIYDLSVNNIDIVSTLVINDLSVNQHASIYDLSVSDLIQVGTGTIINANSIETNTLNSFLNDDLTIQGGPIGAQHVIFNQTGNSKVKMTDLIVDDGLRIYKTGTTNFIATYNNTNTLTISTDDGGTGFGSMNIKCGEELDITSKGYTKITASQGIDLSANGEINFTASNYIFNNNNATTTNTIASQSRTLTNFGETYSIIDMSLNPTIQTNNTVDISSVIYSNIDNSVNIFPNSTGTFEVDFIGLQFNKSIVEIYYTMKIEKTTGSGADAVTVELKESSGLLPPIIDIGTRSIAKNLGSLLNTTYGPITLYFDTGSSDSQYLNKKFNLNIIAQGGDVKVGEGRLTIKQKSIV